MTTQGNNLNRNISTVNGTDDREARPKFWYTARVHASSERQNAKKLNSIGIETYVPQRQEIRQWSDREKTISSILIPLIVIIKMEVAHLLDIQKLSFIFGLLKYPGQRKPAAVPDDQIESLGYVKELSNGKLDFIPDKFKARDKVTILQGNFSEVSGIINATPTKKPKYV